MAYSAVKQCVNVSMKIKDIDGDYGSREGFYSIGKGIASGLQGRIPDETLKALPDLIFNNKGDPGQVLTDFAKAQAGGIAFFSIGIILAAVLLIISCILCCALTCCCSSKRPTPKKKTSGIFVSIQLLLILVAGAFVLTGVILFCLAVDDLFDGIERIPASIAVIAANIVQIGGATTVQLGCFVEAGFGEFSQEFDSVSHTLPARFFHEFGLQQLRDMNLDMLTTLSGISEDAGKISEGVSKLDCTGAGDECTKTITALGEIKKEFAKDYFAITTLYGINTTINEIFANIEKSIDVPGLKDTQKDFEDARRSVNETLVSISSAVDTVSKNIEDVEDQAEKIKKSIDEFSAIDWVKAGFKLLVTGPGALMLLALFIAAVAAVFRLANLDTPPNRRSSLSSSTGCVMTALAVVALSFAWIVMLTASVGFAGGYGVEAVCYPMFEDEEMRVYTVADVALDISLTGMDGQPVHIKFSEVLKQCKAGATVFNVFNGSQLIDIGDVINSVNTTMLKSRHPRNGIEMKHQGGKRLRAPGSMPSLTAMAADPRPIVSTSSRPSEESPSDINAGINNATLKNFDADTVNKLQIVKSGLDSALSGLNQVKPFLKSVTDPDTEVQRTALTALVKQLQDAGKKLDNVAELVKNQSSVDDHKRKTKLVDLSDATIDDLGKQLTKTSNDFVNSLIKDSLQCAPIFAQYTNTGNIFCEQLGKPIQGAWAAAGLAALFFLPGTIAIICLSSTMARRGMTGGDVGIDYTYDEDTNAAIADPFASPPHIQSTYEPEHSGPSTYSSGQLPRPHLKAPVAPMSDNPWEVSYPPPAQDIAYNDPLTYPRLEESSRPVDGYYDNGAYGKKGLTRF